MVITMADAGQKRPFNQITNEYASTTQSKREARPTHAERVAEVACLGKRSLGATPVTNNKQHSQANGRLVKLDDDDDEDDVMTADLRIPAAARGIPVKAVETPRENTGASHRLIAGGLKGLADGAGAIIKYQWKEPTQIHKYHNGRQS
jgi:hypothetical protein